MASNQSMCPNLLGFYVPTINTLGVTTLALNATATWLAMSFSVPKTLTLARLKIFCTAVGGTLAGTDLTADIYSDAAGVPNASLVSSATLTNPVSANTWSEFGGVGTGFNQAITGGTQYWAVFKNLNGTAGTNFPTFQFGNSNVISQVFSGIYGWNKKQSANSGGAWITTVVACFGLRLEFTDGSFSGFPFQNAAANASALGIYANREFGSRFTTDANSILKVAGLGMFLASSTGTPSQPLRLGLWTGASPVNLAYTNSIPVTSVGAGWVFQYFPSVLTIQPGTICRATIGEVSQSDVVGNRYNSVAYTVENDANSQALLPFVGTAQQTYFDGTTWTDTPTAIAPFALALDTVSGPFGSPALFSPLGVQLVKVA